MLNCIKWLRGFLKQLFITFAFTQLIKLFPEVKRPKTKPADVLVIPNSNFSMALASILPVLIPDWLEQAAEHVSSSIVPLNVVFEG